MRSTLRIFSAFALAACAITSVQSQFEPQTNVKRNRDCGCSGYEAKANQCGWDEPVCDESSVSYKNYKFWCEQLNDFRDAKREGWTESIHTSTCTCYANLSLEEREAIQLGLLIPKVRYNPRSLSVSSTVASSVPFNTPLPARYTDYSTLFGPVKSQARCGSCWAFATVAMAEYWHRRFQGRQYNLSEQRLVSCATTNMYGCGGGWPQYAMDYMLANGNVQNVSYPYTSGSTGATGSCKAASPVIRFPKNSYFELHAGKNFNGWATFGKLTPGGNCTRLKQLLSKGPVQVNIQVIPTFYQYKSGIYYDATCPTDGTVNHAVVAVGYIKNYNNTGIDVYKVRNSWGLGWGDKGHIYMSAANNVNNCGICSWFTYF